MDIEKVKIGDLKINKDNPRKITNEKMDKLVDSILVFPKMLGIRPIVVDGNMTALGGNQRTEALKRISKMSAEKIAESLSDISDYRRMTKEEQGSLIQYWSEWLKTKEVPVINAESLTEDEKKQFIIKDNNSFGEWNYAELTEKWDTSILSDWGVDFPAEWYSPEEEKKEAREDDFSDEDAANAKTRVKAGEIWQLGEHRLMCGDSTKKEDVIKLMNGEMADLYLTDPPYNVDYEGKTKDALKIQNDSMDDDSFRNFLLDAFASADNVIKPGAAFYIWHADSEGFNFRYAVNVSGWLLKQCLIWNKNTIVLGRQDYQWEHESCLYGWKDGAPHYFIKDRTQATVYEDNPIEYKKMKKSELIEIVKKLLEPNVETTILNENKPFRSGEHPTMKPIRLMGRCIINSSKEGWIVLDSFGGSGSTLIACEQLNRKARLMELDPHYCDVIISRWEKFTGKEAVKIYG